VLDPPVFTQKGFVMNYIERMLVEIDNERWNGEYELHKTFQTALQGNMQPHYENGVFAPKHRGPHGLLAKNVLMTPDEYEDYGCKKWCIHRQWGTEGGN
jgi:hypothetical protein